MFLCFTKPIVWPVETCREIRTMCAIRTMILRVVISPLLQFSTRIGWKGWGSVEPMRSGVGGHVAHLHLLPHDKSLTFRSLSCFLPPSLPGSCISLFLNRVYSFLLY